MTHIFLCDLTHTGQKVANEGIPYAIGCIAAYVEKYAVFPITTHLFKFVDELYESFNAYQPKIVGFSNYAWNINLSLQTAKAIKRKFPETIIVFGGPNFPSGEKEKKEFLTDNDIIDFYIEGEGERAFLEFLTVCDSEDYHIEKIKITGAKNLRTILENQLVSYEMDEKISNLDEIPSPYLTGKLDNFFKNNLIPLVQISRGCPFTCAYCLEGNSYYSNITRRTNIETFKEEITYIAKKSVGNRMLHIVDSNFGMYENDVKIAEVINATMDSLDFPSYVHVSVGKNKKERILKVAKLLKGRLRLSGSVQSLDPEVLQNIKRKNISQKQLLATALEAKSIDANSYSEVILGLPGDTLGRNTSTMKQVIDAGFNVVECYTLMMLWGAEINSSETIGKYGLVRKFRILPRCFGKYNFGQDSYDAFEIEEVCVTSDSLPFKDYLECRDFALTVAIFYNDQRFLEILEILQALGIKASEWISVIHNKVNHFSGRIKDIYDSFRLDTENELWDSKKELEGFVLEGNNMDEFIHGRLGFNVLYKHVAKSLLSAMDEVNKHSFSAAFELMETYNPVFFAEHRRYLEELERFNLHRKSNIFNRDFSPTDCFYYDFGSISKYGLWSPDKHTSNLLCENKVVYSFFQTKEQLSILNEQLRLFGDDELGFAKILTRIPIHKLYREFVKDD